MPLELDLVAGHGAGVALRLQVERGLARLAVGARHVRGVQVNSFKRWGDYSSMTVDPQDDCTFWFTQEFYIGSGSFNWATHVGAFKFDRCKPGGK